MRVPTRFLQYLLVRAISSRPMLRSGRESRTTRASRRVAKVVGHDARKRITPHRDIVRYMEALASAAPSRMKLFDSRAAHVRRTAEACADVYFSFVKILF